MIDDPEPFIPINERLGFEEFNKLFELIEFHEERNLPVPKKAVASAKDFIKGRMNRLFRGKGDDNDLRIVVAWHWPETILDSWQPELIRKILSGRYTKVKQVFIKGCTGSGKGCSMAIAANLWYEYNTECKVVLNGPSHDHVSKNLFAEIAVWRKKMEHVDRSDVFKQHIESSKNHTIYISTPDTVEGFSGHHSKATIIFYDEASMVMEDFWKQGGTMAKIRVAASNPRVISGFFFDGFPLESQDIDQILSCSGGMKFCKTISALDCMNVIEEKEIIKGQITKERLEEIKSNGNRWYQVMGLGRFPEDDDSVQVVGPTWIMRHKQAWREDMPVTHFSLDVAASLEGDKSVLSAGGFDGLKGLHETQTKDQMKVTAWVLLMVKSIYKIDLTTGKNLIVVDCDGVGKGVGDRLTELGCRVLQFFGNERSSDPLHFSNNRTEAWGRLGQRLDPQGEFSQHPWGLINDSELIEDLLAGEKVHASDGVQWALIPKRPKNKKDQRTTFYSKIKRSPDKGDSVAYLFHGIAKDLAFENASDQTIDDLSVGNPSDPAVNKPFSQEEIEELPDDIRDLVESTRELSQGFDDQFLIEQESKPTGQMIKTAELQNLLRAFKNGSD